MFFTINFVATQSIRARYRNHRGEVSWRHFIPVRLAHGVNDWHEREGWYLIGYDLDRQANRDFALDGFLDADGSELSPGEIRGGGAAGAGAPMGT